MTAERDKTVPHYDKHTGAGSDRPFLVMIHGASQNSGLFSAQVKFFSSRYRLIVIDLPGHGRSGNMGGPYGPMEYARSVTAALDDAGVDRAHYWGTHTGAAIGLLLATQFPARLKSLILEGVVLPGIEMPYVVDMFARARATLRGSGIEAARLEWFTHAGFFDAIRGQPVTCRSAAHWNLISEFGGRPWSDEATPQPVGSIIDRLPDTPTLLINGQHDLPAFVEVADLLQARLPQVERTIVARAGGFPLWEYPGAVNARVASFLRRQDRKT